MWPEERLRRARTLLLELERLYNHVNDIGQICAGVGLAAGAVLLVLGESGSLAGVAAVSLCAFATASICLEFARGTREEGVEGRHVGDVRRVRDRAGVFRARCTRRSPLRGQRS